MSVKNKIAKVIIKYYRLGYNINLSNVKTNLVEDFPTVITTTEISPPRRISVPGASGSWSKSTSNPNSFSSTDGWPTMSPTLGSNSVGSSFWGDMKKSSKMTPFSALTEEVDSEGTFRQ